MHSGITSKILTSLLAENEPECNAIKMRSLPMTTQISNGEQAILKHSVQQLYSVELHN